MVSGSWWIACGLAACPERKRESMRGRKILPRAMRSDAGSAMTHTLLFAARDEKHDNAEVLKEALEEHS